MACVRDTCAEVLAGLDDDVIEYIVGAVESGEYDQSELSEIIQGLTLSHEYVSSEEDAADKCSALLGALTIGEPVKPVVIETAALPVPFLVDKISPPAIPVEQVKIEKEVDEVSVASSMKSKATKTGKDRKTKTSKKTTAADRVESQIGELEAELEDARIAAAKSRSLNGAYKGAIEASNFTLANPGGGAPLLENASCTLVRGRRYGLIGRNGKGKSTLLRALAARRVGNVPTNVTVHYVSQDVQLTEVTMEQTPVMCVVAADIERRLLLEEAAALEDALSRDQLDAEGQRRQQAVIEQLQLIDADTAERRATQLLENLGFSAELRSRPLKALSGGWRVRTMLAAAIFARPDMLLLDEPTNHLSILAVLWLARELSTAEAWQDRTVVIVSHDRFFMDEVCSDVLHISGVARRLTQSHGNYTAWAARRKEQQLTYSREAALRETEIKNLREYAGHGFKYGGSASQINKMAMKAKQADKLAEEASVADDELAALQEDLELPLNLAAGGELDGFLIQALGVGFHYPGGPVLFSGADFGVTSKSRIVLLGENGNGKTTLVKLLLGELQPTSGEIKRSLQMRVALVNQHHADQIDLEMTPLQFMLSKFHGDGSYDHEMKMRGHLASCGVSGGEPDLQNVPSSALSGGQRSRVALAAVSYMKPHVLVLDEPTNNLDLESVAALAASVKAFKGAVIVVSHDQYFVTQVADEAWVVNAGAVKRVSSFEAYRTKQLNKLSKTG